jgi:signal transduction histidine kinase
VAPDLLTLFAEPSVALLYFMAMLVLSGAALFMALGQRLRGKGERAAAGYAWAAFGVLVAWLALMGGALAVLLSGQPNAAIMPPLERAVNAFVIAFVGFAFLRAEVMPPPTFNGKGVRRFPFGALFFGLLLVLLAAYGYTAYVWYTEFSAQGAFNGTPFGIGWTLGTAALCVLWLLLLLINARRVPDVPLKLLFFIVLLAGYGYTGYGILNAQINGSEAGALRLAFLIAMPLLAVVVYRLVITRLTQMVDERAAQATVSTLTTISTNLIDTTVDRESMTLLKTIGTMIEREKPEDLPRQIVIAAASVVKADIAALLVADDQDYADVLAAFDVVQQRPIAAMAFKLDEQPTLQESLASRIQRSLSADQNLNEMVDLYTRLDIQKIGPVYFQPLTREGDIVGVLVVALPYTQRNLRENERRLLESISPAAARLLMISRAAHRARLESQRSAAQAVLEGTADAEQPLSNTAAMRAEMQASLELARSQINELSALVRDLQIELDYERSRIAEIVADDPEGLSISQRIEKMSSERSKLESERERLVQALQEAQTQLATASGSDDEMIGTVVRVLQQERDDLLAQKEMLERQLLEIRSGGNTAPAMLRDLLTRQSEERARLEVERDQLRAQLSDVEAQLRAVGIEGGSNGLITTLANLTDERSRYKAQAERASQERDTLRAELQRVRDLIATADEREAKISALENDLRRLAGDREALARQRDSLRHDRESTHTEREQWESLRTRMVAEMAALQQDLEAAIHNHRRAAAERDKLKEEMAALLSERDKLAAGRAALQSERDQLLARVEGNREVLQQLGAEGIGTLKTMIDDLTEERSELEHQLLRAQGQAQRLKEQLDDARRKLSTASRSAGSTTNAETLEVLLSMAQELRTPLGAMSAYIDLLLNESVGILGDLQRQFLLRVKSNGERLATLIEEFVRVVAIDSGQVKLHVAHLDLGEVIDDAITATQTQFLEKGITLRLNLPDSLPIINGDRSALQQVLIELLSNAYRASPDDGEVLIAARHERAFMPPVVNGTPAKPAEMIVISVRDFGGGVPPEEQARVFSRMFRADTPLVAGLGDTGVGLSIARALTEAHHGHLWFESERGTSSTFTMALPVQLPKAVESHAS